MALPDVFLIELNAPTMPTRQDPDVQQPRSIKEQIQSHLKQIIPLLKQLNMNDRQLLDAALISSLDDRRLSGTALISSLEALISRLEDQAEPGGHQPQPSKKRKHGPAGISLSIEPADSVHNCPELDTGTGQAVLSPRRAGKEGDALAPDRPRQLEHCYSDDESLQAEAEAEDNQAKEKQADFAPPNIGRAIGSQDPQITGIDEASEIVNNLLGPALESLLAKYLARSKIKGMGSPQYTGIYYQEMAARSLYTLVNTPITINSRHIHLTKDQAINIVKEVFTNTFPNIFDNISNAHKLESWLKSDDFFNFPLMPTPKVILPGGGLIVQQILHNLELLENRNLLDRMRQLRLLFELRAICNAVMYPSADISVEDSKLQDDIKFIQAYGSQTHIQSQTKGVLAETKLANLVFRGDTGTAYEENRINLEKYRQHSAVIYAMVQTFSSGCIWMTPNLHSTVWEGLTGGLDAIFSIIKRCDPDDRMSGICRKLNGFAVAYTAEGRYKFGEHVGNIFGDLDVLLPDPLHRIMWLLGEDMDVRIDDTQKVNPVYLRMRFEARGVNF